ncbi:hypothetical protein BDZ94DRAFT_1313299, partial [Collybia nuda]
IPQKGHVHIYANRERRGLPTFLKLEVTPTLGPVLESLSDVLSPVRRQNQRIFVFEETGWAIKGRYETALRKNDEAFWVVKNGLQTLDLYIEPDNPSTSNSCHSSTPFSTTSDPPASGTFTCASSPDPFSVTVDSGSGPTLGFGSGSSSVNPHLAAILTKLGVPVHLTSHNDWGLCTSFAKWKGYLDACSAYKELEETKKWNGPPLNGKALIELFVSKSHFHENFTMFGDVIQFPEMVEWLENSGVNSVYNREVWGYHKINYNFKDLSKWLDLEKKKQLKEESSKKSEKKKKGKEQDKGEGSSKKGGKDSKDKDSGGKKGGKKSKQVK